MPRTTTRAANPDHATDEVPLPPEPQDSYDESDNRSTQAREQGTSTSMGKGREALRQHRQNNPAGNGNFPQKDDKFKVPEDERILFRFLDDDFFITYYEHEFFKEFEGEKRQKTFICLGDDCPLCQIGDKPRFYALINVLLMGKRPAVKLWFATPGPGGLIEDQMIELEEMPTPKTVADSSFYFQVSKTKGKNGFFDYKISRIKSRDLEEDKGVTPLSDPEIASYAADKWTDEFIRITPRAKLREIADELDALSDGD